MPLTDLEPEPFLDEPRTAAKRSAAAALAWGVTTAICAAGLWAGAIVAAFALTKMPFTPADLNGQAALVALLFGSSTALSGAAGAIVGFVRGGNYRGTTALILGAGGALFGALGGGGSALAVAASGAWVRPLVSSSVVWAFAGLLAGVSGYHWSRWLQEGEQAAVEEEADPARVAWLLREQKRRWRDRALVRVSPVLLASAWALVGAAAFAQSELSLGLLAVGVLGLCVSLVLYNQETRLRTLEERFPWKREE